MAKQKKSPLMKAVRPLERRTPEQVLGTPGREYMSYSGSFNATRRDRSRSGPMPFSGAADAHLDEISHDRLRCFCNDIDRNSSEASSLLDAWSDTLCGEFGYGVQAWTEDEDWNARAEESFRIFCESPTIDGDQTAADLEKATVREWGTDGDCGFIWTNRNLVQSVESERICNPGVGGYGSSATIVLENGGRITRGVETDAAGRRVAYHVAEYDRFGRLDRTQSRRIPAESFFFTKNPFWRKRNQNRGLPHVARIVRQLAAMAEFDESTVLASIVGCNMMMAIYTENPQATREAMSDSAEDSDEVSDDDLEDRAYGEKDLATMSPLSILHLKPNERATGIKPEHPTTSYESFRTMQMRMAANAFGLPYAVGASDSSKTNYYGMKAERGILRRRQAAGVRELVKFVRWLWKMWIGSRIDAGELLAVEGWDRPRVVTPSAIVIDETQEIAGADAAVNGNYRTHRDVCQQMYGTDSDEVKRERAMEKELDRELGIVPMGTPGAKPADGQMQGDPNQSGDGASKPGNDPNTVEEAEEEDTPRKREEQSDED